MTAEEYFNNSSYVTSDLLDVEGNKLGLNTNVLFQLMEDYHIHKKDAFKCSFYDRGKNLEPCPQHCGSLLCEKG